jgi:hypothetical protein
MRRLLEEISFASIGREETLPDDALTPEEKTQLRELCVLILISEFLENNTEFHHRDTKNRKSEKSCADFGEEAETTSNTWPATKPGASTGQID